MSHRWQASCWGSDRCETQLWERDALGWLNIAVLSALPGEALSALGEVEGCVAVTGL